MKFTRRNTASDRWVRIGPFCCSTDRSISGDGWCDGEINLPWFFVRRTKANGSLRGFIWQPHASLLVLPNPATGEPFKCYETRHWAPPQWLIGQRIAIHAAKNKTDLNDIAECFDYGLRAGTVGWSDGYNAPFISALRALGFPHPLFMPRGAIIGTAILAACHRTETLTDPGPFGDFSPGRYAWEMADAVPLPQPVPFRGLQGLFDAPDEVIHHG